jgi:hypothetical protein
MTALRVFQARRSSVDYLEGRRVAQVYPAAVERVAVGEDDLVERRRRPAEQEPVQHSHGPVVREPSRVPLGALQDGPLERLDGGQVCRVQPDRVARAVASGDQQCDAPSRGAENVLDRIAAGHRRGRSLPRRSVSYATSAEWGGSRQHATSRPGVPYGTLRRPALTRRGVSDTRPLVHPSTDLSSHPLQPASTPTLAACHIPPLSSSPNPARSTARWNQ